MKTLLVALTVTAGAIALVADSQLIPLVDAADPVRITNASVEAHDTGAYFAIVELANQTATPINVQDVWLNMARFYTPGERAAAGTRLMWDCARIGHVGAPVSEIIVPGGRVITRTPLGASCHHRPEHEHFFVTVERLQGVNSREPSWKREPSELSRLLGAAQPHP
jgi:hypothetical protein